jgi:hypothetical protein
MDLKYTYKSTIGDYSDDGHGKTDTFVFKTNKTKEQLDKIHKSCNTKLGFRIGEIASDYEDNSIPRKIAKILLDQGFNLNQYIEYDEEENYTVDIDTLPQLWLSILKHIDPSFEYEIVDDDLVSWLPWGDVPGYGCFW